jgi:predicted membrane protein
MSGDEQHGAPYREWRRRRSPAPAIFYSIALIVIGVLLFLDALDLLEAGNLWRYWPLALIAAGAAQLPRAREAAGMVWAALLIAAGAILLLDNVGVLPDGGRLIWPLLFIGFGLMMLLRSLGRREAPAQTTISNRIRDSAVFGGTKRKLDTQDFNGGEAVAVFGGVELDLRRAAIPARREVVLRADAVFGAVDIWVPEQWNVSVRGTGVFGAYEDKTVSLRADEIALAPRLVITGVAVFGGVVVKN